MKSSKYHKIRLSRARSDTWGFLEKHKVLEVSIISIATIINSIVAIKYYDILVALLYEIVVLLIICLLLFFWKSLRTVPERIYEEQEEAIEALKSNNVAH